MNETETRPTPEEIAEALEDQHDGITSSPTIDEFTEALAEHGYRIVHPDDVPDSRYSGSPHPPDHLETNAEADAWDLGWNACRAHIFGGDDE